MTTSLVAGGASGLVEAMCTFPTEFVKTQLQLQGKGVQKFSGPWDVVVKTVKAEGPLGLYRGLGALLLNSVPQKAVRFAANEFASKRLRDEKGRISYSGQLLAGAFAGTCEAVFPVTPAETIKTKLIHDFNRPPAERKYRGVIQGVPAIIGQEGFGGIYKGLTATIIKQSSNQATRFLVLKYVKDKMNETGTIKNPTLQNFIGGMIAGGISVYVNNPIDVVKTKMQGLEAKQYKNTLDCAWTILKTQGPMFFYKGVTPRVARVCGDAAISFTVYYRLLDWVNTWQK